MRKRYALLGASAILALALAVPALGGPSNPIAQSALKLSKVNKTAKSAKTTATAAQAAAAAAQATGDSALSTANGKQSRIRWAYVNTISGTITSQSGGISLVYSVSGDQYLDFGSSQVGHALMATRHVTFAGPGEIAASLCGGVGNPGGTICPAGPDTTSTVRVQTYNSAGALQLASFYVASIP